MRFVAAKEKSFVFTFIGDVASAAIAVLCSAYIARFIGIEWIGKIGLALAITTVIEKCFYFNGIHFSLKRNGEYYKRYLVLDYLSLIFVFVISAAIVVLFSSGKLDILFALSIVMYYSIFALVQSHVLLHRIRGHYAKMVIHQLSLPGIRMTLLLTGCSISTSFMIPSIVLGIFSIFTLTDEGSSKVSLKAVWKLNLDRVIKSFGKNVDYILLSKFIGVELLGVYRLMLDISQLGVKLTGVLYNHILGRIATLRIDRIANISKEYRPIALGGIAVYSLSILPLSIIYDLELSFVLCLIMIATFSITNLTVHVVPVLLKRGEYSLMYKSQFLAMLGALSYYYLLFVFRVGDLNCWLLGQLIYILIWLFVLEISKVNAKKNISRFG